MRRLGRFWFSALLVVASRVGAAVRGDPKEPLIGFGIGLALLVAYFPIWRWLARKHPNLATEWQPDLLSESPHQDRPMRPSEPISNVHLVGESNQE